MPINEVMDYEMLTLEKKQIILDLALKADCLRPELAETPSGKELPERVVHFAKTLAESIQDPSVS
jgi:hypothetical protein